MALDNKVSSMTAFSQCILQENVGTLSGELRAVNHRYFELSMRLPDALRSLEIPIRDLLRETLSRGKIDLNIRFEAKSSDGSLILNKNLIDELLTACQAIAKNCNSESQVNIVELLRWPGALMTAEQDQTQLEAFTLSLVNQLVAKFQADRCREGAALRKTIEARLHTIAEHVAHIVPHAEAILQLQREKLLDRLNKAKLDFDPHRLEQELVYWAQKNDIAEELDRLRTHIDEINDTLKKGGAMGRRLDFLVQELHREANTLGAKSLTSDVTYRAVEIKVLIEQIREQVQNIE